MTTANEITDGAHAICGVKQPTDAQDTAALTLLNNRLALMSAEGLIIPVVTEESFTLVVGTGVYTMSSGGDFDTVRPMRITKAYIRDSDGDDHHVSTEMSLDEYNRITTKSTQDRPTSLYYAPEYPLGKIHFNLTPDAAETLSLFSRKPLTSFATLATTMNLPGEYALFLEEDLALHLAPRLNVRLDPTVLQTLSGAHASIRTLNRPKVGGARYDDYITRALEK